MNEEVLANIVLAIIWFSVLFLIWIKIDTWHKERNRCDYCRGLGVHYQPFYSKERSKGGTYSLCEECSGTGKKK